MARYEARGSPTTARKPDSAVLVLLLGDPVRVLVVRKSCEVPGYWSCDIALPGGSMLPGETPVDAALREAWEEVMVHPSSVRVKAALSPMEAGRGLRLVVPVVGVPKGPIDPRPSGGEVDFAAFIPLSLVAGEAEEVEHPRRGVVRGRSIGRGLVIWGFTYRVLRRVHGLIHQGMTVDPYTTLQESP